MVSVSLAVLPARRSPSSMLTSSAGSPGRLTSFTGSLGMLVGRERWGFRWAGGQGCCCGKWSGVVVVNHEGIVKALATETPGPSRRRRPCGPCDQAPTQLTGADLILIHMPHVTRPLRPRLARIIMSLLFFHGTARRLIPGRTGTHVEHGGLPERPMGADCKSAAECYGGSNPSPATMIALLWHVTAG